MAAGAGVPLTVIGGFLGTGKTTLLNRVLQGDHGVRYAVLVNDFGSLAIDTALVTAHGGDTVSFANGCVCCSLGDGMLAAVDRLLDGPAPPEQFLVEGSGVADPRGIADLATLHSRLARDLTVVMVDVETVRARAADARLRDTLERQFRAADLLVLNRCDRLDESGLTAVENWLHSQCDAPQIRTVQARLPLALLQAGGATPRERHADEHLGEHHHQPQATFRTETLNLPRPTDPQRLREALLDMAPTLLRAKGFVRVAGGGWLLVQLSGRQLSVSPWCPPAGAPAPPAALVLIGLDQTPLAAALAQRLTAPD